MSYELIDLSTVPEDVDVVFAHPKRQVLLSPAGWADVQLWGRLTYQRFDRVVERAQREVLRAGPDDWMRISVRTVGAEATSPQRWGEFYPPDGPIVLYQLAYELMPDMENYYRQIKAVLVHEYEHSQGEMHDEPVLAHVARR